MTLNQLAALLGAAPWEVDQAIGGFSIDSRHISPGDCFIAITGERFDGHDFIESAFAKGAICAVIAKQATLPSSLPNHLFFPVDNTLDALKMIAAHHRKKHPIPVIALTGSCGKTTVKEMIACCLPSPSLATIGNLNNHIGVPLSLLALKPEHQFAVFELGANHAGEIAANIELVRPSVALINNIGTAHLETFGSVEGIADAKAEIFQGLLDDGIAVINRDDERVVAKSRGVAFTKLRYSVKSPADVYASEVTFDGRDHAHCQLHLADRVYPLKLNVPGRHNLHNALAAACCCLALGIDDEQILNGLARFGGVAGRLQMVAGRCGARLIDDSYNASLQSVFAALDVLSHYAGQRILVLGELAEVGVDLERHYEQIANYAESSNIDCIFTVGKRSALVGESFAGESAHFLDKGALVKALLPRLNAHTTILIKGSRSAQMEQVVYQLQVE